MLDRPSPGDCAEYYFLYIDRVPNGNVLGVLDNQLQKTPGTLTAMPADKLDYRYASGKWSIKEIVGHLIDVERTFSYRAMCFARNEPAPLPSLDQDPYIEASRFDERSIEDIAEEYEAVRRASLVMFRSFNEEEWSRRGIASGVEFTAATIPFILAGHEIHHMSVIREKYL